MCVLGCGVEVVRVCWGRLVCLSVVELLPSPHEALGLSFSTQTIKRGRCGCSCSLTAGRESHIADRRPSAAEGHDHCTCDKNESQG